MSFFVPLRSLLTLGFFGALAGLPIAACGSSDDGGSTPPPAEPLDGAAAGDGARVDASQNADDAGEAGVSCNGIPCTAPPAATCANATTLRVYAADGACQSGACSYGATETACPAPPNATGVCTAGACSGFTCKSGFLDLGTGCVFGTLHNTWAPVASMTTPRYRHGSAAGPDGRVYVVGGTTGPAGGPLTSFGTSVEAYTPSTNTWATLSSMPTGSQLNAAVSLGGKVYRVGGATPLEAYTPATNTWATLASLPAMRFALAAAAGAGKDNHVYAIGGTISNTGETTVFAYTPTTNAWASVASMATPRILHAAAVLPDGRIYAISGQTALGGGSIVAGVEVYTPSTNTWASAANIPTPRSGLAAATASDGRIYAIGGDVNGTKTAVVEAYSPVTNTWVAVASMPVARSGHGAAVGADGRIYVTGDLTPAGGLATVYAYTP